MLATTMNTYHVVELLGDGISTELSQSVHAIAAVLPCGIEFTQLDLSEPNRRSSGSALYEEAVAQMKRHGLALKYPTATTAESPNQVLRDLCQFAVIHRPVATLPGIENNFKKTIDLDVVRIATGGTYEDGGRRIGDECAVSVRVIERKPTAHAARFAFQLAAARGTNVVSTSKWTIQKATDGLFEQVVDEVRAKFPAVPHRRELFDSLLAGLIMKPERYSVIVCPNEYGDFLSDMACGLIGSIGLGDSASYAFDEHGRVTVAMFDPAGGTAPDLAGKDLCNPMAALLALCNLLRHVGELQASQSLRQVLPQCLAERASTRDVGGTLSCSAFTAEVARRFRSLLARA
jgi:isocitrate dehydrogenase (NAD+)